MACLFITCLIEKQQNCLILMKSYSYRMCSKTQQYDGIFSRKKITGAPSRTIVSFKFVPVVFQREAEVMQIATVWAFLDVWYGCVLLTVEDCICLLYPAGIIKVNPRGLRVQR